MFKTEERKLWSVEAEAAVLGSAMLDSTCIPKVSQTVGPDAFYDPKNQIIFNCLYSLFIGDLPTDAVALRTELKKMGLLDKAGGVEYIGQIIKSVPSSANASYYASVVQEKKRYRDAIAAVESMETALNEPGSVDERIEAIQDIALGLGGESESGSYSFKDYAAQVANSLDKAKLCISTGFRNIDYIIEGVSPGELIVLAGRPSMGKSALALQFAQSMAKVGKRILFFTLEMTYESLIQRALQQAGTEELSKLDVTLIEGGHTPEQQIAFMKTHKYVHGLDVVFVDYLQLMTAGRKSESRNQEISAITRKLKLAAVREDVPIIVLSQLNRQVEGRAGHKPRLSDLRESGSIEQDADVVMLLHREDYYRKNENPDAPQDGSTELIIAKNRRGPTGVAKLVFLDEKVVFGDLSRE